MARLTTIGYQEAAQAAILQALAAAGIEILVDVRAVTASRRPGFAKRQLSAGCAAAGIDYLHLRGLGTPAEGRLAARTGRFDELRRIYEAHLETLEAQRDMTELRGLLDTGRRICLLCYEREPHHCHRLIVAERLGVEANHLMPLVGSP